LALFSTNGTNAAHKESGIKKVVSDIDRDAGGFIEQQQDHAGAVPAVQAALEQGA
jgi:hypothetical protein